MDACRAVIQLPSRMLNPITYTERVVGDFLRYQLTTYPFADERLHEQMRRLLSLEHTRATPLLRGPYISLSRSFRRGAALAELAREGVVHPFLGTLAPFSHVYGHQEEAIRAIVAGRSTLVATGTGSGKTECFLYPIISRCLTLRDEGAPAGITAVIVYPMNALAEDQLGRLRELLTGTGVSFAMYTGRTGEKTADVAGVRLAPGASRADYRARVRKLRKDRQMRAVHPPEERASREEMRARPPRILLTNVKQLELILTRQRDVTLFDNARLEFLVFDEAHTFSGASGAETACLIRRLRAFCGKRADQTVCVATSATIADPDRGPEAGRDFATRFFGVTAASVALVGEQYENDAWAPADQRVATPALPGDPVVHLQTILEVVASVADGEDADPVTDGGDAAARAAELRRLRSVFQVMTGQSLDMADWQQSLYDRLAGNEVVFAIAEALNRPRSLAGLCESLASRLGRPISEHEILSWLALGACSRRHGRPLLRPVVHGFVRGISGAVVTFAGPDAAPTLWLSAGDATERDARDASDSSDSRGDDLQPDFRLPVTTCTTCGQHYFVHHADDFQLVGARPGGGKAIEDRIVWEALDQAQDGQRVVLLDRLVGAEDDSDDDSEDGNGAAGDTRATAERPPRTVEVYFCHRCGALHPAHIDLCDGCGAAGTLLRLYAVRSERRPGYLTSCLMCGAIGRDHIGRYREPSRPVRALTVSDVHVLGQSMIQHAERRRLLIFADNRQDAAFQAGWMQDHARRYRFRALMYERVATGPVSVGDLVAWLDEHLDGDDDLSRALMPEVWSMDRKEAAGHRHAAERRRFLRIQVLREVATGSRQRIGLEPWGRVRVDYLGLDERHPFFARWSEELGHTPAQLCHGVAGLLDSVRRARMLLDREAGMFSRYWHESDREIQRGYMPHFPGGPRGLKLRRLADDHPRRVQQWLSARGDTKAKRASRRWGLEGARQEAFFDELWPLLTDEWRLLAPVTLVGNRGRALSQCADVVQVDADNLLLTDHRGVYRCKVCRHPHTRPTPGDTCMAWRCPDGVVEFVEESSENYDLTVLDQDFAMVRPREHSAQVPANDREVLERMFKGSREQLNTLVCTPTLELGVDIGGLDGVLMRNVPPLPANYWQRAGRAGRRHRMAVNLTYARPASHDRAYFVDPLRMLEGLVRPPSFNLENPVMLHKHVHAAVLSVLFQLARDNSPLADSDRLTLQGALEYALPVQISRYLFDDNRHVRQTPFDVQPLARIVARHRGRLIDHVCEVFSQGWPERGRDLVTAERLGAIIDDLPGQLEKVIARLAARLRWAMQQIDRLNKLRPVKGTLDPEEDALFKRCDRLVKKLKGVQRRKLREAEGHDDINTYGVLAAEGFLPGYGLASGWVVGYHLAPPYGSRIRDWQLRRSPSLALREYVPGNLVYANGHKFIPRFFHLEAVEPTLFQVDSASEAVTEVGTGPQTAALGMGAQTLAALPICDVDLPHNSQITDDEDYRFQLSVAVYGLEQKRHGEGRGYDWGGRAVQLRRAVHLRLVNVGTSGAARSGEGLGYPVCTVCGHSRSPFAGERELAHFSQLHHERCGQPVGRIGFYTDTVADALGVPGCVDREQAFSVVEALRQGAAQVLDMEVDDLQLLAMGRAGLERIDVLLYDPMPGGSGLLQQVVARWSEVVEAARGIASGCASQCERACIDCLFLFRNAYYHRYLNRHTVLAALDSWGSSLQFTHPISAQLPNARERDRTVNQGALILARMFERAGFGTFVEEHRIDLGLPLKRTVPDFYFEDSTGEDRVCVYLDGMSGHLHGNPTTHRRDLEIRETLRNRHYDVLVIQYSDLFDRVAMQRHFFRLGRILLGRERARGFRTDDSWFDEPVVETIPPEEKGNDDGAEHEPAVEDARWDEYRELLHSRWHGLLTALRASGVPAPFDVERGWLRNGRTSDDRVLMVWETDSGHVGVTADPAHKRADDERLYVIPEHLSAGADSSDENADDDAAWQHLLAFLREHGVGQ